MRPTSRSLSLTVSATPGATIFPYSNIRAGPHLSGRRGFGHGPWLFVLFTLLSVEFSLAETCGCFFAVWPWDAQSLHEHRQILLPQLAKVRRIKSQSFFILVLYVRAHKLSVVPQLLKVFPFPPPFDVASCSYLRFLFIYLPLPQLSKWPTHVQPLTAPIGQGRQVWPWQCVQSVCVKWKPLSVTAVEGLHAAPYTVLGCTYTSLCQKLMNKSIQSERVIKDKGN